MNAIVRFHLGLFRMPTLLKLWVGALVAANIVAPLFFFEHVEARLALAVGLLGIALMCVLTGRYGFSRIVGLGHVGWLPLLAVLIASLPEHPASTGLGLWLRSVIVLDAISLAFDAVDAIRFARGDHAETVGGLPGLDAAGERA